MSTLETAIQLIRQEKRWEAQRILQELINADPANIQAWFWYVETCTTTERRIQVLEDCLDQNPGHPQVMKALQMLRSQAPVAPPKPPPPAPPVVKHEPKSQPAYSAYDFKEDQEPYASSALEPVYESQSFTKPKEPVWEYDPSKYEDNSMLSRSKKPARTYSTLDVWGTALMVSDEKSYADLLLDPKMGLGRAFSWIAIAGFVSALAVPLQLTFNPQFAELMGEPEIQGLFRSGDTSMLIFVTLFALMLTPIASVINLAISGGLQHFLALFFGGGGNYTRTVYALAAFLAPMTMVTSFLAAIPLVGQCLAIPLGLYNLVLNVRALKAAHSLTNGAAIGVVLAPAILAFAFICLAAFALGTSLPSS